MQWAALTAHYKQTTAQTSLLMNNQAKTPLLTTLALFLLHTATPAQTQRGLHEIKDNAYRLNLTSDVKAKSSSNTDRDVPTTGTGALGVSFSTEQSFGSVTFNVFNRQAEVGTADSTAAKPFTNNLLIPENSGAGFSNFNLTLGLRNIWANDDTRKILNVVQLNRIGCFGYLQFNNTQWTKDSVSTPLFIQSHGLYVTYRLLDLEIDNDDKDDLFLTLFAGYEGRRIGGDYALDKNKELRKHFLGTEDIAFDATAFGVLLELGQFYGKLQTTAFGPSGNLDGFSGWQALVTLGVNIEFNLKATNRQASDAKQK